MVMWNLLEYTGNHPSNYPSQDNKALTSKLYVSINLVTKLKN